VKVREKGYSPSLGSVIDRDKGYSPSPDLVKYRDEGYSPSHGSVIYSDEGNSPSLISVIDMYKGYCPSLDSVIDMDEGYSPLPVIKTWSFSVLPQTRAYSLISALIADLPLPTMPSFLTFLRNIVCGQNFEFVVKSGSLTDGLYAPSPH
jgi:hypothetical protein